MPTSSIGAVGIIANPAAGKDIRRLVSAASSTSDMAKIGILRRAVVGAIEGGASKVLIANDHRSFGYQAIAELDSAQSATVEIVGEQVAPDSAHTTRMATLLRDRGCGALLTLGGDGTHRDVVKGWRQAPLVAISTGTNNVFPATLEATTAGQAAAVAARHPGSLAKISHQAKYLEVTGEGIENDLALIDLALVEGMFTASRAVWDIDAMRALVVTTAERATIGLSAIAATMLPTSRTDLGGVHVVFDAASDRVVRAPVAPGLYLDAHIASAGRIVPDETITLAGPGVLAFDGERDLVLNDEQRVLVTLRTNGPFVIRPSLALALIPTSQA